MKLSRVFKIWKPLVIAAFPFLFFSCAAILSGANQKIKIKSQPMGAEVYINGQNTYRKTPCKVEVERRQKRPLQFRQENNIEIGLKKEGYKDTKVIVNSSFNVASVPSICLAGVPFVVDLIVGAHLRYPRNNYLAMKPLDENIKPSYRPKEELSVNKSDKSKPMVSDVDIHIPETRTKKSNAFALVIGNEHYASLNQNLSGEVDVSYAINDAGFFKEYLQKSIGIPEQNIILIKDGTLAKMQLGIQKLSLLAKSNGPETELYFYYAGHGLPNEMTRESYLLPVDLSGSDVEMAIPLNDVYARLSENPSQKVTCILDCCFSGGARNKEIVATRGVKIVPKANPVSGNMVVLSASTGQQTAQAYNQKQHGLFTYFVLKKLQESKGKVQLGELYYYLKKEVAIHSLLVNDKEQYPQIVVSPQINQKWEDIQF